MDGVPFQEDDYGKQQHHRHHHRSSEEERSDSESEDSRGFDRLQGDSEERRTRLRQVEIKVLQYQDELERGLRSAKQGYSVHRQVQHYRHKLLKKVCT